MSRFKIIKIYLIREGVFHDQPRLFGSELLNM